MYSQSDPRWFGPTSTATVFMAGCIIWSGCQLFNWLQGGWRAAMCQTSKNSKSKKRSKTLRI